MSIDFNSDFFSLFGLEPGFALEHARLDQAYREIQSQVHPDRFAHLPEAERRVSMQWSTRVNEAYRTLRAPLSRAQYLLQRQGVETLHEDNRAMSPTFLMEQMEWREAAAEAREAEDVDGLERLHHRLRSEVDALYSQLERDIDHEKNFAAAADAVRRLMFVLKLKVEIDESLESLES